MKANARIRLAALSCCVGVLLAANVVSRPAAAEVITSAGKLRAEGSGKVWVYGQGQARFRLLDDGKLIVRHIGDNRVVSNGDGTRLVSGTTLTFIGYKGTVTVSGDKIAAYYSGGRTEFEADGAVRVILAGEGTYKLQDQDPVAWDDYGTTIIMGSPTVSDEDQVWGKTAEYEAQTVAAVREIQSFPAYREWSVAYPEAAVYLVRTHDYYHWCTLYPYAVTALYAHPRWGIWIGGRPRLFGFVAYHDTFVVWYNAHPGFRPYFCHPVVYHTFAHHHPSAFASISVGIAYTEWSWRHPQAAHSLDVGVSVHYKNTRSRTTTVVAAELGLGTAQGRKTAVLRPDERSRLTAPVEIKPDTEAPRGRDRFRVDVNNDGVVDKAETKSVERAWKAETDKKDRKDAVVDAAQVREWIDNNKDGKVRSDELKAASDLPKNVKSAVKDGKRDSSGDPMKSGVVGGDRPVSEVKVIRDSAPPKETRPSFDAGGRAPRGQAGEIAPVTPDSAVPGAEIPGAPRDQTGGDGHDRGPSGRPRR